MAEKPTEAQLALLRQLLDIAKKHPAGTTLVVRGGELRSANACTRRGWAETEHSQWGIGARITPAGEDVLKEAEERG